MSVGADLGRIFFRPLDHWGELLGLVNFELLVNAGAPKHHVDVFDSDFKNFGQISHHEVCSASIRGAGSHADFELMRKGLADGGFFGRGCAQYIEYQCGLIPLVKLVL